MPPRIPPSPRNPAGPQIQQHVTTIGVRRPAWGTSGRAVTVHTNHFEARIPQGTIHHYDVIAPADKVLPARLNLDFIKQLQEDRPDIFTPKAVYDGRKNLFAIRELPLANKDEKGQPVSEEFKVSLPETGNPQGSKGPKEYKIRITKVAQINSEVLHGFLQGRQSHDNAVLTAITALNVVIRMLPISKYPFNVRSFFTNRETKDIGGGLVLWRGYFQSIRPGGTRMWINIDISTGTMYKSGPLINLCLDHIGRTQVQELTPQGGFTERDRIKLQRFISGIRVVTVHTPGQTPRVVKKLTALGAQQLTFQTREGGSMNVAQYFRTTYRKNLDYPNLPCVEVGSGALLPLELCMVPPGQIMRKQVPPEKTRDVLLFSTQKPQARLQSIRNGLDVFEYGQSEYLRSFGMQVNTQAGPLSVPARILEPPSLKYGRGSRQPNIKPDNGAWNMRDKKFYRPAGVKGWIMVVFERNQRFNEQTAQGVAKSLCDACTAVGITGMDPNPLISYLNAQGPIRQQLAQVGTNWKNKFGSPQAPLPNLIVAVLPENATDLYTAIKHFGDCIAGVSTQCLKALKCSRGSAQYFANVCLKLNVKLGGINCVPLASDVPVLTDPSNPTLVLGADVIHPSPGSGGRPSFTALVGNVDSENSKYIARSSVQESRVEMIQDLQGMTRSILDISKFEQNNAPPKKVIFFRDGVSEGQFKTVLTEEVPRIKDMNLKGPLTPKLTVIVVGKRHHVRFFPTSQDRSQSDQSGNCRAGTVVDREISHPTEFDFYLQSHAGLLGTSRPAHYNILLDENNFSSDGLQQLAFALCHVYARSTRSVSIPAPVYYADIVCSRAKNHFDPQGNIELDSQTVSDGQGPGVEAYKSAYKQPHPTTQLSMYFS
ncbi:argonaute-like protein [Ramaria rubella]|nr:argonaute-like protein [Ramaria rubella]